MNTPEDEEFTELRDASIDRVDLVDKAANGTKFLIAKRENGAGLMNADFVRDLIGKTAAAPAPEDTVTMTGSPGALMRLIHEASLRKEKYDTADRKDMGASGAAMPDGSYPIEDHADLERAIRAVGRGGADHDAIRRHVIQRAKALGASSEIPENWAADGSLKEVTKMAVTGELDDGVDGMDPTVVLAEPDDDMNAPGDMNEPGSPAWEAIDAATARKWCSIAVRLRNALCVMAEREMLEAASADPDDAMAAWDLQDAECALDYVIDTLAGFAVEEQAEAELAGEAMEMVGKALSGFDIATLDTFEALAPVAKAGRVLSSANEAAIRSAAESLQKVLASLPQAPTTDDVTKTANEEPSMPEPTPSQDVVTEHGAEPAMGAQQATPKPVAGTPVTDIEKADGEKKMVAVYDKRGNLVGIVDPEKITMIEGAEADDEDDTAADMSDSDESGDDTETTDLTPEPPAEAGTPADAVPTEDDDADVTKTTNDSNTPSEMSQSSFLELVKSALGEHSANTTAQVATIGDAVLELAGMVETLKGQIKALEEQPAEPRVFTNGATPPRDQMRGQDRGAPPIDVTKAAELKATVYRGYNTSEQKQAADTLMGAAIARLSEIHQGR